MTNSAGLLKAFPELWPRPKHFKSWKLCLIRWFICRSTKEHHCNGSEITATTRLPMLTSRSLTKLQRMCIGNTNKTRRSLINTSALGSITWTVPILTETTSPLICVACWKADSVMGVGHPKLFSSDRQAPAAPVRPRGLLNALASVWSALKNLFGTRWKLTQDLDLTWERY